MDQTIYLDVYFVVNLLMDLSALALTALALSEAVRLPRLVLAAAAGALLSCGAVLFSLQNGALTVFALFSFLPVNWIAFGYRGRRRFFLTCLFSLLGFLFLGGVVDALGYTVSSLGGKARVTATVFLVVLLLSFGGFSFWETSLRRRLEENVVTLVLIRGGKEEEVCALVDSASFLRDPVSSDSVILVKADSLSRLFTPKEKEAVNQGGSPKLPALPIPIRTASGQSVLFAVRLDEIRVKTKRAFFRGKRIRALIALDFSDGGYGGCPALLPLSVLE